MIVYMNLDFNRDEFINRLKKHDLYFQLINCAEKLFKINRLCWISGGAVRDFILDRSPYDIDMTTDATDQEILDLFPNAVLTGQKFGVYKLPIKKNDETHIIDLTVFRTDAEYLDGRRPVEIIRSTPELDAYRRDFTINALFFDLDKMQLIDYVGGLSDLKNQVLKTVGDAASRFSEDYLRILRCVRFQAVLDFKLDKATEAAAFKLAEKVNQTSGERICEELSKVSQSKNKIIFWKSQLTHQIMNHIGFQYDIKKSSSLSPAKPNLVFDLVFLANFSPGVISFVKDRLKCSKDEVRLTEALTKEALLCQSSQQSLFKLAVRLEKSEHRQAGLYEAYFCLTEAGLFSPTDLDQAMALIELHPEPLLSVVDLKNEKAPEFLLSKILEALREMQFAGTVKTKDQAIAALPDLIQKLQIQKSTGEY